MKSPLSTSVLRNSGWEPLHWVRPLEHFVWLEFFRLGQNIRNLFFCSPSETDFGKMKKNNDLQIGFFSLPDVAVHQLIPDHKLALAIRA